MSDQTPSFDALMPKDMAVKAENIGIIKAGLGKFGKKQDHTQPI